MAVDVISEVRDNANHWAQYYKIPEPKNRGGDAYDAYRHAYAAAYIKELFLDAGWSEANATMGANILGSGVEFQAGYNYEPGAYLDFNMDFWNDAKGAEYDPKSGLTPQEYVKKLYDNGELITDNTLQGQKGRTNDFSASRFLEALTVVSEGLELLTDPSWDSLRSYSEAYLNFWNHF